MRVENQQMFLQPSVFTVCDLEQLRQNLPWQKRYKLIISWAALLPPMPALRIAENRVKGCEAEAWLAYAWDDSRGHLIAIDSDSRIVRGLGVVLICLVQQQGRIIDLKDVEQAFDALGLRQHISLSRSNGVRALLDRILLHNHHSVY